MRQVNEALSPVWDEEVVVQKTITRYARDCAGSGFQFMQPSLRMSSFDPESGEVVLCNGLGELAGDVIARYRARWDRAGRLRLTEV